MIGGVVGISLSFVVICLQIYFSFFKIPGLDTAYPVAIDLTNLLIVLGTLIFVGILSGLISSGVVKKFDS